MGLLIPIAKVHQKDLEHALDKIARYDWAPRRQIHTFPIDGFDKNALTTALCVYCRDTGIDTVLLHDKIFHSGRGLRKAGYKVIEGPGIHNLIWGHGLGSHLRQLGLDWRSQAMDRLKQYAHGTIGEAEIDLWLSQFDLLGDHRTVGEQLLQLLDVLSLSELGSSLSLDSDFNGDDLMIGFNQDSFGKSWSTVTNLIRKKCPSATILPITKAIEAGGYPKVLRLVEDGLFSGTEVRAIFDSLRGVRPTSRVEKVPGLLHPNVLSKMPAQLYFGAVTDFGVETLRHYMEVNVLPNIQVVVSAAARKIRVLVGAPNILDQNNRSQHVERDQNETFKSYLRSRVVPYAFQGGRGWRNDEARKRGRVFCEDVGEQLWRNYISARKNYDASSWPPERIRRCALGMEGLGLTFA